MNQDDPDYETIVKERDKALEVEQDFEAMFREADKEHILREASSMKKKFRKEEDKTESFYQERKRSNKPEFNKMVKRRREKAKHDAKARKRNRKKR